MAEVSPPIPQPATVPPRGESTTAVLGSDVMSYALDDHQHPRLTSATAITLDGSGNGTVTFTRTFAVEPVMTFMPIMPSGGGPVVCEVTGWVMTNSLFTGATIKGWRIGGSTLAAVTVLGISVAVGGQTINPVSVAANVKISIVALVTSAV